MSHFLSVRYRCLLAAGMGLLVNYTAEARAQSASPAPLPIAVMLRPIEGDEHTAGTLAWLGDAITGAISDAGMAAISRSPLALTVRVSSRSAGQSDAGMRRVVRSEVSLLFTVHLASANGMAGSVRLTRFGTGRDAGSASASAVQSLTSEPELIASAMLQLARDAERTIERSCSELLASATERQQARDFDEAIALLMSVPAAAPTCRARAQASAMAVYQARSAWQCGRALQDATTLHAAGRFDETLQALRYVDPLSPCMPRIRALIETIRTEAVARDARAAAARAAALQREWAYRNALLQATTSLERQRLIVLGDIAAALLAPAHR